MATGPSFNLAPTRDLLKLLSGNNVIAPLNKPSAAAWQQPSQPALPAAPLGAFSCCVAQEAAASAMSFGKEQVPGFR